MGKGLWDVWVGIAGVGRGGGEIFGAEISGGGGGGLDGGSNGGIKEVLSRRCALSFMLGFDG